MPFPTDFATERLLAERLLPAHAEDIHRMHLDPVQMAHLGGPRSPEQSAQYMEKNLRHWDEYGFGTWILRDRESGAMAGRAVLRHLLIDAQDEIEVGYGFYPRFWGRGLAQEITRTCLNYARRELGARTVVALTAPLNLRSHRVLIQTGFRLEREVEIDEKHHCLFRTHPAWDD
jgi:ribosomal-protein-alanine N-acetyltransferase